MEKVLRACGKICPRQSPMTEMAVSPREGIRLLDLELAVIVLHELWYLHHNFYLYQSLRTSQTPSWNEKSTAHRRIPQRVECKNLERTWTFWLQRRRSKGERRIPHVLCSSGLGKMLASSSHSILNENSWARHCLFLPPKSWDSWNLEGVKVLPEVINWNRLSYQGHVSLDKSQNIETNM